MLRVVHMLRMSQGCQPKPWLQRRKGECSVECSLSLPHCKFICLNHTNCHDDYITTGLKNVLWFSFFYPFSKINRADAGQARPHTWSPRTQGTKGPTASWLPRQRNRSALGSSERPCPSKWTHKCIPHANLKNSADQ